MKNSGSILIGIIAAAAAGVVVGLLIAPEKGDELRKDIKDSAGDWVKKLSDLLSSGKEQAKSLKSSFADGVDDLKHEVKSAKSSFGNGVSELKHEFKSTKV